MLTRYFCCLLVFISSTKAAQAQKSQSTGEHTVVMSAPLQLPLLAYVAPLTIKPSSRDSLYQSILSRQRVRTIIKLRIRPGAPPDTMEYMELDRRGNNIMLYVTGGQQRSQMKYDNQNRLVEKVQLPSLFHSYQMVEKLDPQQNRYESFRQENTALRQPLMSARQISHGDTTITTTQFHSPLSPQLPIIQTVCRSYREQGDTNHIEVIGYDSTHQALGFEAYVFTKKAGRQTSTGVLHFQRDLQALLDTSAQVRQWRSQGIADAEILVRRRHQLRGLLLFTDRFTYDQRGQLVLQEQLDPEPLRTKPVTRTTKNGSITIGASFSTSMRYVYDKNRRIIQQTTTWQSADPHNDKLRAENSVTVDKKYTSNGLLHTETTSQQIAEANRQMPPSQVEYHYTYY